MGWTLTENLEKLIRDATERLFLGKAIEFSARLARSVSGERLVFWAIRALKSAALDQ
jgi:hypothetical protein